jgi:hypothetical protein
MDALIARIVPKAEQATWKPATPEQIARIEEIAERPLPSHYAWFLRTMGGAFPHPQFGHERQDLRAATVIRAYDDGIVDPDPRYLLIGRIPDPAMPELVFYDLDAPARDDAMVVMCTEGTSTLRPMFETLREKLAWGMLRKHRVAGCPQRCEGSLSDEGGGEVLASLGPALASLGFSSPVPTGPYCGLFEREDAALTSMVSVSDANRSLQLFNLGGPDATTLRRILGEVATMASIEVRINRFQPPLPE